MIYVYQCAVPHNNILFAINAICFDLISWLEYFRWWFMVHWHVSQSSTLSIYRLDIEKTDFYWCRRSLLFCSIVFVLCPVTNSQNTRTHSFSRRDHSAGWDSWSGRVWSRHGYRYFPHFHILILLAGGSSVAMTVCASSHHQHIISPCHRTTLRIYAWAAVAKRDIDNRQHTYPHMSMHQTIHTSNNEKTK